MEDKVTTATANVELSPTLDLVGSGKVAAFRTSWLGSVSIILLCLWPLAIRGYMYGEVSVLRILLKSTLGIVISLQFGSLLFKSWVWRHRLRYVATSSGALVAGLVGLSIAYPEVWRFTQWLILWGAMVTTIFSHLQRREPEFFDLPRPRVS